MVVFPPKITHYTNSDERISFLRKYLWIITYTDGHVTSHKMLEFMNKRTMRNVVYKEPIINLVFVACVFGLIGFLGYMIF